MSARKALPPPRPADTASILRGRYRADPEPSTSDTGDSSSTSRTPSTKARGGSRRSWYMSAATEEAFAALVDELHWSTRKPKTLIWDEIRRTAEANRSAIERALKGSDGG